MTDGTMTALNNLADDDLVTLVQAKDEAAFAELMRRTSSSSFKLALSILKDRQEAEDEVQNAYWNAWRHVGQFQRDSKFSTWISRIVVNQCLMKLRKLRRANFLYLDGGAAEGEVPVMELPDRAVTPEVQLHAKECSAILHREIRRLPPLLRNALVLSDLEGLSMNDVARQLGISLAAAKSRLLRARSELKHRLRKHAGTASPAMASA